MPSTGAADHDLVITSGGVSTGDADHVRTAIEQIGRLVFWRVAIKPGRPVAMGVIPSATPGHAAAFTGLPGNPAAVYVTFVRVVWPLLLRLAGAEPRSPLALPVRATFAHRKRRGRREYVRVSLRRAADGVVEALKFPRDGAATSISGPFAPSFRLRITRRPHASGAASPLQLGMRTPFCSGSTPGRNGSSGS